MWGLGRCSIRSDIKRPVNDAGRSLPALEALCAELSREAGRVGLVVRPNKTKYMRFSASPS
jgi:hypothetical protein